MWFPGEIQANVGLQPVAVKGKSTIPRNGSVKRVAIDARRGDLIEGSAPLLFVRNALIWRRNEITSLLAADFSIDEFYL